MESGSLLILTGRRNWAGEGIQLPAPTLVARCHDARDPFTWRSNVTGIKNPATRGSHETRTDGTSVTTLGADDDDSAINPAGEPSPRTGGSRFRFREASDQARGIPANVLAIRRPSSSITQRRGRPDRPRYLSAQSVLADNAGAGVASGRHQPGAATGHSDLSTADEAGAEFTDRSCHASSVIVCIAAEQITASCASVTRCKWDQMHRLQQRNCSALNQEMDVGAARSRLDGGLRPRMFYSDRASRAGRTIRLGHCRQSCQRR